MGNMDSYIELTMRAHDAGGPEEYIEKLIAAADAKALLKEFS